MKLPILLCLLFISRSYASCMDTCDTYMGTCYSNTDVSGCTSNADCCATTSTGCTDTCDPYYGTCNENTDVSGCSSDADCCPTDDDAACTDTCDTYMGTCYSNTDVSGCTSNADCCATGCTDYCNNGNCFESMDYCSDNADCCATCDTTARPVADPPIYGVARQSQQYGDENMNMICKKDFDNDNSCTVCPDGKTRCLYDSDCSVCLDADDAGKRYCANSPNTVECTNDYDCFGYTSGYIQNIFFGADASTSIYYGLECSQNICTDGMTTCAHDNDCYICQSSGVCGVYADSCDPADAGLPTCAPLCLDPVDTTGYANVVTDRRANTVSDTPFMYYSEDNADFACAEGYTGTPEAECNKGQPLVLSGCEVAEVPFSGPDWADGDDGTVGAGGFHSTQDYFRIVIDGVEKTTGTLGIFQGETLIHRTINSNVEINSMILQYMYSVDSGGVNWNYWDTQFKTGAENDDPNGELFTLKFWDGTTEFTLAPQYAYNNNNDNELYTFTNPTECTTPTTTGYDFTSATGSLAKASFSRTGISCASGYSGEVTINECTEAGQPYSVSGCVEVPTCGTGVATHDCLCNGARRLRRRLSTATCVSGEVCQSDGTCVVHCEGEFGGYGACSDGKKSRQYDVTIPASNGGDDCDHPDDYIDEQDCTGLIGDQCSDNAHCDSENCDGNSCAVALTTLELGDWCWDDGEVQGSCPAGSTCYRRDDAYDRWVNRYGDPSCDDAKCLNAISDIEECRFNGDDSSCQCINTGVPFPVCTNQVASEECICGNREDDRTCSVGYTCFDNDGFYCEMECPEDTVLSADYDKCICAGGPSCNAGQTCDSGSGECTGGVGNCIDGQLITEDCICTIEGDSYDYSRRRLEEIVCVAGQYCVEGYKECLLSDPIGGEGPGPGDGGSGTCSDGELIESPACLADCTTITDESSCPTMPPCCVWTPAGDGDGGTTYCGYNGPVPGDCICLSDEVGRRRLNGRRLDGGTCTAGQNCGTDGQCSGGDGDGDGGTTYCGYNGPVPGDCICLSDDFGGRRLNGRRLDGGTCTVGQNCGTDGQCSDPAPTTPGCPMDAVATEVCECGEGTCTVGQNCGTDGQCSDPVADVNCAGSWGEWSACSGGTQSRTFTETTAQSGNGAACPASPESDSCGANGESCSAPSECVSGHCVTNVCVADPNALNWVREIEDTQTATDGAGPQFVVTLDGTQVSNGKLALMRNGYIHGLDSDGATVNMMTGEAVWNPLDFLGAAGWEFEIHYSPDGVTDYTSSTPYTFIASDTDQYSVDLFSTIDQTWNLNNQWDLVSWNVKPSNWDNPWDSIPTDGMKACDTVNCENGGDKILLSNSMSMKYYDLGPDFQGGIFQNVWFVSGATPEAFATAWKQLIEAGTAFKYFSNSERTVTINGKKFDSFAYDFDQGVNFFGLVGQTDVNYVSDSGRGQGKEMFQPELFLDNIDAEDGDVILLPDSTSVRFYDHPSFGRVWYGLDEVTFKPGMGYTYKRKHSPLSFTKYN